MADFGFRDLGIAVTSLGLIVLALVVLVLHFGFVSNTECLLQCKEVSEVIQVHYQTEPLSVHLAYAYLIAYAFTLYVGKCVCSLAVASVFLVSCLALIVSVLVFILTH